MATELNLSVPNKTYNIEVAQNDSFLMPLKVSFSLTGCIVEMVVRRSENDDSPIILSKTISSFTTTDITDDTITISFTTTEMAGLKNGYHYKLSVIPFAGARNTYMVGKFCIL